MITIEAKRVLNGELVDALRHAPADTSLNCLALLLGLHFSQGCQQRDQQIIPPIAGIGDSFCLKLNGNGWVQRRKRSQIVQNIHDISTKTADAFGENQVNLPVNCVGNHFLKAKTFFNGSCADALVLINLNQLPLRICLNPLGKMVDLHIKAADLLFLLRADAAIRRNAEFGRLLCKFLPFLRRGDNNTISTLVIRNFVLHLAAFLLSALGSASGLSLYLYRFGVKRFCHIPPPASESVCVFCFASAHHLL